MLIAFLSAIKSGHSYIPIDTSIPSQRVERIIARSQAPLTLTPDRVAALTARESQVAPDPARWIGREQAFYIIFTSGSTGEPKGVVITLGSLSSFVSWMLAEQNLSEQHETFLNQAPFSFDLSVMDLYLCLATGGTLFSVTKHEIADPAQLFQSFARSHISVWVSTPSFARMCLSDKSFCAPLLPHLRRFLFCGETLTPDVATKLIDRFPQAEVWNTYGPTETTVATTSVRIDRETLARYNPLPVGYPKPNCRVVVLGKAGKPKPDGERGEIVIAGDNVSPGYLGRPDLTAKSFFELDGLHAYRTGDWGRFQDGLLFFEGRQDSQIKLHGHRIELGDVEANLRALRDVRDAVVIPKMKQGAPDSLVAFVILAGEFSISEYELTRNLKRELAERLPVYMLPRKFHIMSTFPMTANGKADRIKLAELLR